MKNKFLLYFPRIFLKPENCIFPRKNKKKHIFINEYKNILLVSISKFYFEIGVNKNAKRCVFLIIFSMSIRHYVSSGWLVLQINLR